MGKITVETCRIEGVKIITPQVFGDERGYFTETYHYNDYRDAGIPQIFVQDNQSACCGDCISRKSFHRINW